MDGVLCLLNRDLYWFSLWLLLVLGLDCGRLLLFSLVWLLCLGCFGCMYGFTVCCAVGLGLLVWCCGSLVCIGNWLCLFVGGCVY